MLNLQQLRNQQPEVIVITNRNVELKTKQVLKAKLHFMKTLLMCSFLILFTKTFGQTALSGEVAYVTKVNMHKNLPNNERAQRMKEWIPEFTEFNNQLLFTATETVYKNVQDEAEEVNLDAESEEHGPARWRARMLSRMAPPNDIIYTDVENGYVTAKKEFMDKIFLIRDTVHMSNWKLTGEQKEVAGMNCMKAEYIPQAGDTSKIIVWFTPEIPVSSGPAGYGGLPGLIVHLDKDDGAVQISLSSIVMRDIEKGEIEEPKKGKEVTQEEFDEIVRLKREQQRQEWESRGGGMHH